jgi:peroxiredoxin
VEFFVTCSCLPFPPWRPRLALAVALGLLVPACSDASDDVLTLIDEPIPIDDIQTDVAVGSGVDLTYATFDGGEANFVAYAGTPLVINFFARTCPPCVSEMPEFERVFNELRGEVAFVGISTDPRQQDAQTLVEETGVTYDLGWDPDGRLFAEFGGFAMPTTVFVTADGIVSEVWSGVLSADELQSKIEEIT